jgi:homocitrate synthase
MTDEQVSRPRDLGVLWCSRPPLKVKDATSKIKELADVRTQSMDDVDSLLRVYHSGIQSGELAVGQKETLDRLLREHREKNRAEEVTD